MQTAFTSGDKLLHYRLIQKIGEGGMGVVYKAEDDRLGRTVAVKLLQPSISSDRVARERFLREARAASAIDHPNLCTIHAVEEAPDGSLLLVMSYYRGQTLTELLKQGPLSFPQLRSIGEQTARGLHAAHLAGVVHRDIKPANIFLLQSGDVKILDFGLSRMAQQHNLTMPHTIMGTLAYMPPEQLAGTDADHRADIWALGVVLYEMAAGHTPFSQPTHSATITAITAGRYTPLHQARPDLPPSVYLAVERALRQLPHERHTSAAEFIRLLTQLEHLTAEVTQALSVQVNLPRAVAGETAVYVADGGSHPVSQPYPAGISIAVLPMHNVSSDPENEYFSDGLTDELISSLGALPTLRVVSRTSAFSFKGTHQTIRYIGRALEVNVVLEGSVRRSGSHVRVSAQLTDVLNGFLIWSERFDRELSDIFELQDELASAVVAALRKKLAPDLSFADLQPRTPMQVEAYEIYLKGRYHWQRKTIADIQLAGRYFEQALKLDPTSAVAHAGIADYHSLESSLGLMPPHDAWQMARASALQSLAIDPDLAEAHLALASVLQFYDWNWQGAREHIVKALELRPQRGESYSSYVSLLMTQGLLDEALEQTRLGLACDPLSTPLLMAEALLHVYLGNHDDTILLAKSALAASPQYAELYYALGMAQVLSGRTSEAVKTFELGYEQSRMPLLLGWLGEAYVSNGDHVKARKVLEDLLAMAENGRPLPVAIAVAAASLEEHDLAFHWLDRASQMRDIFIAYITVFPSLKPLQHDERYHQLIARMKLAHPSTHRRSYEARTSSVAF